MLEVRALGDGAYALVDGSSDVKAKNENGIAAPTSGGFIVTPAGIIVVETYLNDHTACQARNLIVQTMPNVPIKYVVTTSHHGDHIYGNSVFVAEGVKFVMHKNTFTSISDEDFLAGEKSFMQGGFGYGGGIQATAPITEDMQMLLAGDSDLDLMLGGDKVVAKYFGHAQTPGDQFVWHERSQTLFCGNPIIADGPSMPWLLDGNVAGAKQAMVNMKEFVDTKANPVTVVPGHGTPSQNGAYLAGKYIEYLTELQELAAEAVAAGMNLTQAMAHVVQPDYQTYTLYGWVQPSINVPFAFVEAGGKIANGETCGSVCFPAQGHGVHSSTACDHRTSGLRPVIALTSDRTRGG